MTTRRGLAGVQPDRPAGDQPDGLDQQLVLDGMQPLQDRVGVGGIGELERALEDDRAGVDAAVDEVHGDAEHLDAVVERLLHRAQPGERRQQRRMHVDDAVREGGQERVAETSCM